MPDRRRFLAAAGALSLPGLALSAHAVPAQTHVPRRPGGSPTQAFFESLCGEDLQVDLGAAGTTVLRLLAVRPFEGRQAIEQFSLVLRGSGRQPLAGGVYALEHPRAGRMHLRIDPSGRIARDRLYRADLSLLV